jgi:hypothetical protein
VCSVYAHNVLKCQLTWFLQVYTRLKSAFAAHKAEASGRGAAGAVAAAARELRPVEIVGVYEQQREALELDASRLRAEVGVLPLGVGLVVPLLLCIWSLDCASAASQTGDACLYSCLMQRLWHFAGSVSTHGTTCRHNVCMSFVRRGMCFESVRGQL